MSDMPASTEPYRELIAARAALNDLVIEEQAIDQLARYLLLLKRWNDTIRLTALDDPDAAVDRLILEPVSAAASLPKTPLILMDVGSGGGSPAIPLKVIRPNASLIMVESRARKAAFLREVARHLDLTQVTVETARFEELAPKWTAAIDVLSVRAVRIDPPTLSALSGFLKPAGRLLAFTSTARGDPTLPPGLVLDAARPLVRSNASRLSVLRKV